MVTNKILFSGCSLTAGTGWADMNPVESMCIDVKDSPHLWVNLCHNRIKRFNNLELINVGKSSASNTEIFQNTVASMSQHGNQIDTLFCQWTGMPRYNWTVGFELWDTKESFECKEIQKYKTNDVNLNKGNHWSREYINDLTQRIMVMHHLHWEILKVIDYSNIIYSLAKKLDIPNVFFINGLCPWDYNYFVELNNVTPEEYTEFTKREILNIDTRDDKDIHKLYKLAHQHYQEAGGINPLRWINLYNSFYTNRIDTNFDTYHPGVQSNILYYEMTHTKLKELGIV